MKATRELYAARQDGEGSVAAAESQALGDGYRDTLDAGDVTTEVVQVKADEYTIDWSPYLSAKLSDPVDTRVERATLDALATRINAIQDAVKPVSYTHLDV